MNTLYLPLARIALRYLMAALVTAGVLLPATGAELAASEDLALVVAGLIGGVATELAYLRARRSGGAT